MESAQTEFVDALIARRDEVARRATGRITRELDSYRSLGEDAVPVIAAVVGSFYETLVERWRADDRQVPEVDTVDVRPAAGIDVGIPLSDRLAAHRIAGEVVWRVVREVAGETPGLDTDFLMWATSVALTHLNALAAALTDQHREVEHHRQRWRRELERTLVESALRTPPDLHLANATVRALGIEATRTWQVVVALRDEETEPVAAVASLGRWTAEADRRILTAQNGRETRVLVVGTPVEPGDLDTRAGAAVGVGRPGRRLEDLAESYQRAHDAAIVAERRGGGALGVDCTRLERFLAGRVAPDDLTDDLLAPLRELPADQRELIAESLEAYLDGRCSVTAAARRLHLHPQSFRYRLGKLESIFGEDLEDPSRRLLLHVAITRYRQGHRDDVDTQPPEMAEA